MLKYHVSREKKQVAMSVANKDWGSELSFGRQELEQVTGLWGERAAYRKRKNVQRRKRKLETAIPCVRKLKTVKCWEPKQDWFLLTRKLMRSSNYQLQPNTNTTLISRHRELSLLQEACSLSVSISGSKFKPRKLFSPSWKKWAALVRQWIVQCSWTRLLLEWQRRLGSQMMRSWINWCQIM